ncbi:MAG: 16S rRNA (uracil(1498)-N(3))-methyltransferase [Thalassobaculales bacterium]
MFDKVEARLYVAADLGAGVVVPLAAEQAHYLRAVLRLGAGARVAAFNGRDGEWLTALEPAGRQGAALRVAQPLRPQVAEPDLWLVFAPIKRARIDFLAQKATELGVSALWPVMTRHTAMERVNEERLRANAVEAAEQSDRLSVPAVRAVVKLPQALGAWPAGRRLIVCDEGGGGRPIAEALAGWAGGPAALLTGPEGGFSAEELALLRGLDFALPVSLGPRVLRADTAALAALAVFQAIAGDWRTDRPAWKAHA